MPKFGERFVNTMAGDANPRRNCTFVRIVRRRGRLNPGTWWEMTDERGAFWLGNPDTMVPASGQGIDDAALADTPTPKEG